MLLQLNLFIAVIQIFAVSGSREGQLFHNDDTGAVHLMLDGVLRGVKSPESFNRIFEHKLEKTAMDYNYKDPGMYSPSQYFTFGRPLPEDGLIACPQEGNRDALSVYMLDYSEGSETTLVKRAVASPSAMKKYRFSWAAAKRNVRSREYLNTFPNGPVIS